MTDETPHTMKHVPRTPYIFVPLFLHVILGNLFLVSSVTSPSSPREVASFKGNRLSHMVYSPVTQYLYVGGVNRISQLKKDTLDEVAYLVTGPRMDHRYCEVNDAACQMTCEINKIEKSLCRAINTNTVVRGMTLDSKYLYVCYNVKRGSCQRLKLGNVAQIVSNSSNPVVCADTNTKVSMLIGDHPSSRHLKALYMSVTKCSASYGNINAVPMLSTRNLNDFELVQYTRSPSGWLSADSSLDIRGELADYFKIFFRYIFTYKQKPRRRGSYRRPTSFTFHLVVQPESSDSTIWLTRLGRICQQDKFYHSYIEMTLRCTGEDKQGRPVDYNIAEAANLSRAGARLAAQLGIDPEDEVLYVAFRSTTHNQGLSRTNHSAVCIYSMKEIQNMYVTILKQCLQRGAQNIGPQHYQEIDSCNRLYSKELLDEIDVDYCHTDRSNTPLTGIGKEESVVKRAVLQFQDTEVDSIVGGAVSDNFTVVLLGTHDGRLLQYELGLSPGDHSLPRAIYSLRLGRRPIVQLARAGEEQFVYALSSDKVSKVQLYSCAHYRTCEECQKAHNPYCGWCILRGRCETKRVCTSRGKDYWLPYSAGVQCPKVKRLQPTGVQLHTSEPNTLVKLSMALENVPRQLLTNCVPPCKRQCSFANDTKAQEEERARTDASVGPRTRPTMRASVFAISSVVVTDPDSGFDVKCRSPTMNVLPAIPPGTDHVAVRVSLVVGNQPILWSRFFVYDCTRYKSCTSCVESRFPCHWCVRTSKCRDIKMNSYYCSQEETVEHKKALECPRFLHEPAVIRRPSGRYFDGLRLPVRPQLSKLKRMMKDFMCVISCPGLPPRKVRTRLNINESFIECRRFEMTYTQAVGRRQCRLDVQWTQTGIMNSEKKKRKRKKKKKKKQRVHTLENANNASVEVYKCEHMVNNCGECLLDLSPVYHCGWCRRSTSCTLNNSCPSHEWLRRSEVCQNPIIREVIPLNATLPGSVVVTIRGINLGRTYMDVEDGVFLRLRDSQDPMECTTIPEGYIPGKQVRCRIKPERWQQEVDGYFEIQIARKFLSRSSQYFAFLKPVVRALSRQIGPVSGGTEVCLRGHNLAIGSHRAVMWRFTAASVSHKSLPCAIVKATNSEICCITSRAPHPGKVALHLSFDANLVSPGSPTFSYEPDPEVHSVTRTSTIMSGGLTLRVSGSNLRVPSSAHLVFSRAGRSVSSACRCNTTSMECVTPNASSLLPPALARGRRQAPVTRPPAPAVLLVRYGFLMDGVTALRDRGQFSVFPDPELFPFPNGRLVRAVSRGAGAQAEDSLKLDGRHLVGAIGTQDIAVAVGALPCGVVTLKARSLICMLPRPHRALTAPVRARMGRNLTFELGLLVYQAESALSQHMLIIVVSVAAGMFLVVVMAIMLCVYRCHSRVRHRMQRKMDQMISTIEMKVANECKDAFAELQTDMSEVTHALALASNKGYTRLPYRDYSYFCMHQLFPNQDHTQHPVLLRLEIPRASYHDFDQGFRRLSELLKNRNFVVVVVRALEAQSTFSPRDRSNFASLLSAALQSKMEYFTDLLKVLLKDLIAHSVERRKEKLLFRRSESVAEKMLANWLTFLLYDYLKDRAGEPLYLLTQAIWLQISRGPLDARTFESRYALSDEKLLRETLESSEVRLTLVDPAGTFESIRSNDQDWELPVKVLDCDTISQVKEKILFAVYRHTAYSTRPSADDIELELLEIVPDNPEKARLNVQRRVMQDIDNTCETNRSTPTRTPLRLINTLKHYMRLWGFKSGASVKCTLKNGPFETNSFKANENSSSLVNSTSNLIGTMSEHMEVNTGANTLPAGLGHSASFGHFPNGTRMADDNVPQMTNYHLVKPNSDYNREEPAGRTSKLVSEVLLNRMLVTKNCIERYVNDFLHTIFDVASDGSGSHPGDMMLPLCIKYIFDFLDDQALDHNIADPEVIHVWKSNCLPLRFWVGVVKNPDCIFDLQKTPAVDACLSVIAQTLMEACSWSKTQLSKESPSSKLLFARDMDGFRDLVVNYYKDIKSIPAISDQEMTAHLIAHSNKHVNDFNGSSAFHHLYLKYICKYKKEIETALEENDTAKRQRLAANLQEVHHFLEQLPAVVC